MPPTRILTKRDLNRALLERQVLLRRERTPVLEVIQRLIAMQAQQPRPPFIGLWTRIDGFTAPDLATLLRDRQVVRVTHLRGTLHLLTAADYLALRGAMQPVLTGGMHAILKQRGAVLDIEAVVKAAEGHFGKRPRTFEDLRTTLMEEFPGVDERAMGYAARMQLPLCMVPDDTQFAYGADTNFALASQWLGRPVPDAGGVEDLLLRYLAAFGPASVNDAQCWSGLPKLKPAFEALRPKLTVYKDENGKELFDVPGAPLPAADAPAPVRFLPGFDNAILGHQDRSRIIADEHRSLVTTKNLQVQPTILIDGFVAATWDVTLRKSAVTIAVKAFGSVPAKTKKLIEAEAASLVKFLAGAGPRCDVTYA
ncbi:winged helix DNA-binding domain-containing protein [uncultured Paludibaculum sp.]|uniref:winged helix DNA-binding domain-containing protein n=1 Tax=uncultured Paludibaculum sp. TaxID=1765020 RepID=UPI002AAC2172|nr:winged helix DNA-binding domain-containing protein [uncultured Paludibaculum sp.]